MRKVVKIDMDKVPLQNLFKEFRDDIKGLIKTEPSEGIVIEEGFDFVNWAEFKYQQLSGHSIVLMADVVKENVRKINQYKSITFFLPFPK